MLHTDGVGMDGVRTNAEQWVIVGTVDVPTNAE